MKVSLNNCQNANEELTERIQVMSRQVTQFEEAAASREDIEVKFTDYLRNYNENVTTEVQVLNQRLMSSTNEIAEHQVERMVAAREDEDSEMRIQELERRGNMMESSAARIYQKGMEMREEYENQVQHLQGLLGNTEDRLRQMEMNSEFANGVAEKLYADGREMQRNLENSIVALRSQSELAAYSPNLNLQVIGHEHSLEMNTANDELAQLHTALAYSRRQAAMYEEKRATTVVKESRRKVHEANQARLESDHRLRNAEFEIVRRTDMNRNAENEAIARLRMESLQSSNHEMQLEHYETLYDSERMESVELRNHLAEQDTKLQAIIAEGFTASSSTHNAVIGNLENKVMIAEIRAQDMSTEMSELFVENNRLKSQLDLPRPSGGVDKLRDELAAEKNNKLKAWANFEAKMWQYGSE